MALVSFNRVVERYWETVKADYPSIDYDHFFIICRTPFKFIRKQMARVDVPTILVKYWGRITVVAKTIIKRKRQARTYYNKGFISAERLEAIKTELNTILSHLDRPVKRRK